jgi:sec-independent protein translocase protein TatA
LIPNTTELIIISFIILLLFGGKQLPELAKSLGTAAREFKNATKNDDLKSKAQTKEVEEREAILEAAHKLGIETQGRSIEDIAKDIVSKTEKSE